MDIPFFPLRAGLRSRAGRLDGLSGHGHSCRRKGGRVEPTLSIPCSSCHVIRQATSSSFFRATVRTPFGSVAALLVSLRPGIILNCFSDLVRTWSYTCPPRRLVTCTKNQRQPPCRVPDAFAAPGPSAENACKMVLPSR